VPFHLAVFNPGFVAQLRKGGRLGEGGAAMPIVRKVPPPLLPDPAVQKLTRDEAIMRLLAKGLTLEEIQEQECRAAARNAAALVRAR